MSDERDDKYERYKIRYTYYDGTTTVGYRTVDECGLWTLELWDGYSKRWVCYHRTVRDPMAWVFSLYDIPAGTWARVK